MALNDQLSPFNIHFFTGTPGVVETRTAFTELYVLASTTVQAYLGPGMGHLWAWAIRGSGPFG